LYSTVRGRYSRGRRRTVGGQPQACYPRAPYTAVVAEKPKAAEKIALALGKPVKCRYQGIPYWVLWKNGERIIIVPSAGHLFGPHTSMRGFPVYSFEWKPLYEFDKNAKYTYKFYRLMEWILPRASLYINACDYDIEGSVIGYTIIEWFGDIRRYKRMKFSSLSPVELRRAFYKLEEPDTLLVEAGKARNEIDWLWGINVSRALMHAVRNATGQRIILSAGRVQSPTIVEAARRWEEINLAVPLPVFTITILLEHEGIEFPAYPHEWRPTTILEARSLVQWLRKERYLTVKYSRAQKTTVRPPPAFNLGDLQKEAARLYKFSPMKTQSIAEDLYLEALISYPRTNSQKLPPTIDYGDIIRKLTYNPQLGGVAKRLLMETGGVLKPVQGAKDDPAHPAIHPTGELPKKPLDRDHWLIYDLIVRRFLAAFAKQAVVNRISIMLEDSKGRLYSAKGIVIEREGWYYYYPYLKPGETEVPIVREGSKVWIQNASYKKTWQRNTPSLSKTSLLAWMENVKIGTEATRARIIETLFKRKYLESRGGKTVVTDLGMMVATIIKELFPALAEPKLTRELEEKLELIRAGKETRKNVVKTTITVLDKLLEEYRQKLPRVGEKLAISIGLKEPKAKCPICGRESDPRSPYGLCQYHQRAVMKLEEYAREIARRLNVSEKEAIIAVSKLKGNAGKWIIEAARFMLENGLGRS
jgi:DNA topoisomerase-1